MPPADDAHGLQVQLATALRERDQARDELHHVDTRLGEMCARWTEARAQLDAAKYMIEKARDCERAESERDALRTALTEVNNLLMSVPQHEDWRALVRKKVVLALFGEPAWETK